MLILDNTRVILWIEVKAEQLRLIDEYYSNVLRLTIITPLTFDIPFSQVRECKPRQGTFAQSVSVVRTLSGLDSECTTQI